MASEDQLIFGLDSRFDSIKIREKTGYLAQEPQYYDYMKAREVLEFTLRFFFRGNYKEFKNRIEETLDMVGLSEKNNQPIKNFSGGEKQRLGIAQAYVTRPQLLILDEPAASLDPIGRQDILKIMENLRSYTTIFYSTHIISDAEKVSDSAIILNKGRLVAQGPIKKIIASKQSTNLEEAFFRIIK